MKQKFVLISGIILIGIAGLFSSFQAGETRKDIATIETVEGYYIFMYSKPIAPTEYMGTIKAKMTWSNTADQVMTSILKQVKKEYPKADGLIFKGSDRFECEVIKFK